MPFGVDMEIEHYEGRSGEVHVPSADVEAALHDARAVSPRWVHRTVAKSVARGSTKTARLRLERLARVVMNADARITDPRQVWSADWSAVQLHTVEMLDRAIASRWQSVSTRNAMRDAVRSVIRAQLDAGMLSHDRARPMLNALRPEKPRRDPAKQSRGHLPPARVKRVFRDLAHDPSATARRDAALIALMVGAGLRRAEVCTIMMGDLDARHDRLTVVGKGGVVRDVPLAAGVRRAIQAWLDIRGDEPGPLMLPMTKTALRQPVHGRRLSTGSVAKVVHRRIGEDVSPHDLRRTFTGDLLDSGADLSVVSQVLGHVSPATTAGYDRRGFSARRAAVDRLSVPFVDADES